jgi:hypothetical protein
MERTHSKENIFYAEPLGHEPKSIAWSSNGMFFSGSPTTGHRFGGTHAFYIKKKHTHSA